MWGLTPAHLIIVLVILLIVVGPGRLPDTGAAIGKAMRGFKDAMEGADDKQAAGAQQPVQGQYAAQQPVQGQYAAQQPVQGQTLYAPPAGLPPVAAPPY